MGSDPAAPLLTSSGSNKLINEGNNPPINETNKELAILNAPIDYQLDKADRPKRGRRLTELQQYVIESEDQIKKWKEELKECIKM